MKPVHRGWWHEARARLGELRWLHVFGTAFCGKSIFARWLEAELRRNGEEVLLIDGNDLPPVTATDESAALRYVLRCLDLPSGNDGASGFHDGLIRALDAAGRHIYLILDGIDAVLTSEAGLSHVILSYAGPQADPENRLRLVSVASLSVAPMIRFAGKLAVFQSDGFDEVSAGWFDEMTTAFEDELCAISGLLGGISPFNSRLATSLLEQADGHPGLSTLLTQKAATVGQGLPNALAVSAAWRAGTDTAIEASMFPWLTSTPETALAARVQIGGLEFFLGEPRDDPHGTGLAFAVSLGLLHPARAFLQGDRANAPVDSAVRRPVYLVDGRLLSDADTRLTRRLNDLRTRIVHELAADEARTANEDDETLQAVLYVVKREFCDSPRGRARQTEIEPHVVTIIRGKQYALTLKWRHEDYADAPGVTRSGDVGYRYSMLRMFYGLEPAYHDAWQREFSILRELSNAGHRVLPNIRQNATLVDRAGDGTTYGYILIEDEGQRLDDHACDYFRRPVNRRQTFQEIRSLIAGLVRLQARGLVHRMISPRTLRYRQKAREFSLLYGGFEIVTGAHIASSSRARGEDRPVTAALMLSLIESHAARRFVEPSSQSLFFAHEAIYVPEAVMPQSDVYGLCMTLCDLFYGPPPHELLDTFAATTNGSDAKDALIALLDAYCETIRSAPTDVLSHTLRDILLSGLEADPGKRATAIDLQRALLDNDATLREDYAPEAGSSFVLIYHSRNMLEELGRNLSYLLDFEPSDSETAPHELHKFITGKLRGADSIFRDPKGFARFVADASRVTLRHHQAKIVIVCKDISFYCDYARDRLGSDLGTRVLELRYTLDRRNHALAGLVEDTERMDFPNTAFVLCPHDTPAIQRGTLREVITDGQEPLNWEPVIESLPLAKVEAHLEVAYDALQFVSEITWQQRRLMQFPVTVQRSGAGQPGIVIKLNEEEFLARVDRDSYLSLLFNDEGVKPGYFFQNTLIDWLERNAGPDEFVRFSPSESGGIRLPLDPQDIRPGEIRIRRQIDGLEGPGRLTYADDVGIRSLHQTQMQALGRIRTVSRVLTQLERPRPTMALSRAMPEGFGLDLKGRAAEIIWDMVNAHPLFLLQGPPGTGKTRALTEFIYQVLAHEDVTAKFLVTAQSHASVDTTLERVAETLQRKDGLHANERFHIIRHMPNSSQGRVSRTVRESYDVAPQVDILAHKMRDRAEERLGRLNSMPDDDLACSLQRCGIEMMREVRTNAYDEVERRFKRNASLHFVTTSSSGQGAAEVLDLDQKFHTAIVEEAATGWGASLIQPMVEAHSAVLIGDHKQIGPFDSARMIRLARAACGGWTDDRRQERSQSIAPLIFPQYQGDPAVMTGWMEPFRRIFNQIEERTLEKVQGGVKVADTLDTQFRSVRQIGDLVSRTFYVKENVHWGGVEFDQSRAVFDLGRMSNVTVRDPALAWFDTDKIGASSLHRRNYAGGIENRGEIRVLQDLLAHFRTSSGPIVSEQKTDPAYVPINERLMILSPYRSQLGAIRATLREDPARYGFSEGREEALQEIEAVTGTVDSAQGAEASTVIISLARAVASDKRDMPAYQSGTAAEWTHAIRRNYGFLTKPERINVMFSRARQQLVIIGNFEFYSALVDLADEWANAYGRGTKNQEAIAEEQAFWKRLIDYLDPYYVVQPTDEGRPRFD